MCASCTFVFILFFFCSAVVWLQTARSSGVSSSFSWDESERIDVVDSAQRMTFEEITFEFLHLSRLKRCVCVCASVSIAMLILFVRVRFTIELLYFSLLFSSLYPNPDKIQPIESVHTMPSFAIEQCRMTANQDVNEHIRSTPPAK